MFNKYWHNKSGVAAIVFAMALPLVVVSAGIATDLAVAYNAKNRLMNALDKAALAVGSSTGTEDELQERMENFFYANYPDDRLGTPFDVTLTIVEDTITVSAGAHVDTLFMAIFGKDYIDIYGETEVIRELGGIEAVLVLDTTGSMSGSRMTSLKTASTNFLNIMFSEVDDLEFLKIGIVPYASTVNVGKYGLGLNPDDTYYDEPFVYAPDPDEYVTPASNITYGTGTNDWHGCVIERTGQMMTDDEAPLWQMYRYPKICSWGWYGSCYSWTKPNNQCTTARIHPLTNNQAALQALVDSLPTAGNTYSHLGMVWGWRVISPEFPFTEGAEYDDNDWTKTVILMTDGDNTIQGTYSGEGAAGDPGVSSSVAQENAKLAEVCESMKNAGVRVYTITFSSGIGESTKDYYRNCATSTSMYFDAPSGDDLIEVFEDIAHQLSRLHITK